MGMTQCRNLCNIYYFLFRSTHRRPTPRWKSQTLPLLHSVTPQHHRQRSCHDAGRRLSGVAPTIATESPIIVSFLSPYIPTHLSPIIHSTSTPATRFDGHSDRVVAAAAVPHLANIVCSSKSVWKTGQCQLGRVAAYDRCHCIASL